MGLGLLEAPQRELGLEFRKVDEVARIEAPILGEDAIVDSRPPELEYDRHPSLDVVHVSHLSALVDLGLGDEAPELGLGKLALLHSVIPHDFEKAALLQGWMLPVFLVCLVPHMDEGLLHSIAVGRIRLRVFQVLIVHAPFRREAAAGDALQLLELLLCQGVGLLLSDGRSLLCKCSGVEHVGDHRAADTEEVLDVHETEFVGVHDAEDHVDLHPRET
mmetsp:Transcript_93733/g.201192  ORF Transcript_93733/g.201192 Transcript_93733/m.201192 type:complete len:218 (+) Transcript_93733:434-1087(+)